MYWALYQKRLQNKLVVVESMSFDPLNNSFSFVKDRRFSVMKISKVLLIVYSRTYINQISRSYFFLNLILITHPRWNLEKATSRQHPSYLTPFLTHCTRLWSFPLRIPSVNVTKSALSFRFRHIYWKNP